MRWGRSTVLGVEPGDDHPPGGFARLESALCKPLRRDAGWRWARSARLWDLVNTSRAYPGTVPVLPSARNPGLTVLRCALAAANSRRSCT